MIHSVQPEAPNAKDDHAPSAVSDARKLSSVYHQPRLAENKRVREGKVIRRKEGSGLKQTEPRGEREKAWTGVSVDLPHERVGSD
jgi:hypothetical protein